MKMVDMKRTKADKKAEDAKYEAHKVGGDDYPYGLTVSLDHHGLKKLGMHDKLPKVGSKIKLHAHAHVKSAREEQREGGKTHRHVELELRHMAVEHEGKDSAVEREEDDQKKTAGARKAIDEALTKAGGSEDEGDGENEEG